MREWDDPKTDRILHRNGYARDNFVISDDEAYQSEGNDQEGDDDFETIREAGKPQRTTRRQLGPPITTDEKLERLNPTHRMVVEDFMVRARKVSNNVSLIGEMRLLERYMLILQILIAKDLRAVPFTDTILREMAINFPKGTDFF